MAEQSESLVNLAFNLGCDAKLIEMGKLPPNSKVPKKCPYRGGLQMQNRAWYRGYRDVEQNWNRREEEECQEVMMDGNLLSNSQRL